MEQYQFNFFDMRTTSIPKNYDNKMHESLCNQRQLFSPQLYLFFVCNISLFAMFYIFDFYFVVNVKHILNF